MKKGYFLLIIIIVFAALCAMALSACFGGGSSSTTGYRPTLSSMTLKRVESDYVDEENTLCLETVIEQSTGKEVCEQVEVTINFLNTGKYPFLSIKLNDELFNSADFTSDKDNQSVKIVYRPKAITGTYEIKVTEVTYRQSSVQKKLTALNNNVVDVKINPEFNLTVIIPADNAKGVEVKNTKKVKFMSTLASSGIYYEAAAMNHAVYDTKSVGYCKENYGFAGWYTLPNGEGDMLTGDPSNDKFEYYTDMTFYAYFLPVFNMNVLKDEYNEDYCEVTSLTTFGKAFLNTTITYNEIYVQSTFNGIPVTKIGANAFRNTGISKVYLNDSITEIGAGAFRELTSLTTVQFSANLDKIGASAFYGCTGFERLYLPSSLTEIGANAFEGCGWKTYLTGNGSVHESSKDGSTGSSNNYNILVIPTNLKVIGERAFYGHTFVEIHFLNGSTLTTMGKEAFAASSTLKLIETAANIDGYNYGHAENPEAVKLLGERAFYNCVNISSNSLNLREGLVRIGDAAFNSNSLFHYITSLSLPSSLVEIGKSAFYNFKNMTSLTFAPNSQLQKIDDYAFGYSGLVEADLACDLLNYYGASPFYGSPNLKVIKLSTPNPYLYSPDVLQGIDHNYVIYLVPEQYLSLFREHWKLGGNGYISNWKTDLRVYSKEAVYNPASTNLLYGYEVIDGLMTLNYVYNKDYSTLTDITIPDMINGFPVEAVGPYVASKALTKITFPATLKKIYSNAFYDYNSLSVTNLNSLTMLEEIGVQAFYATKLYNFVSNDALKLIETNAFMKCDYMSYVDLNKGTNLRIGIQAFSNSSIRKLRIGANTAAIGSGAFAYCSGLLRVYMHTLSVPEFIQTATISIGIFRGAGLDNTKEIKDEVTSQTFAVLLHSNEVINIFKLADYYAGYKDAYARLDSVTETFENY